MEWVRGRLFGRGQFTGFPITAWGTRNHRSNGPWATAGLPWLSLAQGNFLLKKKLSTGTTLLSEIFDSSDNWSIAFPSFLENMPYLVLHTQNPRLGRWHWAGGLGLAERCSVPREGTDKYLGFGSNFTMFGFCTGTRLWVLSTLLSYVVHPFQEKLYKMKILYCHGLWLLESHTNTVISCNI